MELLLNFLKLHKFFAHTIKFSNPVPIRFQSGSSQIIAIGFRFQFQPEFPSCRTLLLSTTLGTDIPISNIWRTKWRKKTKSCLFISLHKLRNLAKLVHIIRMSKSMERARRLVYSISKCHMQVGLRCFYLISFPRCVPPWSSLSLTGVVCCNYWSLVPWLLHKASKFNISDCDRHPVPHMIN